MRIINIITQDAGVINEVTSFGVFEEQLVNDVVEKAEELFMKKAKEYGFDEEDCDDADILSDGWYESPNGTYPSVAIVWSDI